MKHIVSVDPVNSFESNCDLPDEKESEFIFPGGYSKESTEASTQKGVMDLDESGQPLIEDADLIEQFEHDCSLHQDRKIDMNISDEEKKLSDKTLLKDQ